MNTIYSAKQMFSPSSRTVWAGAVAAAQSANSALFYVAVSGTEADVRAAIKAGADVSARNEGEEGYTTALIFAAIFNTNAEVIKALLAAGSDVNARDEYGATALMWAAFGNKNPDVVKVLIEAGANRYAKAKDGKRAIDLLEIREDKDEFYGTDAYWKMRDLLLSTGRTSDDKKLARPYSLDSTMYKPLKQGIMTSAYGYRVSPISGQWKFHAGVDLAAPAGSNVFSCLPGKITVAKYDSVYGNYILITHYNGYSTLYAHLSSILVKVGDKVDGGKIIGKVGTTGASTGPHLHFEVRKNGKTENPATLIKLP